MNEDSWCIIKWILCTVLHDRKVSEYRVTMIGELSGWHLFFLLYFYYIFIYFLPLIHWPSISSYFVAIIRCNYEFFYKTTSTQNFNHQCLTNQWQVVQIVQVKIQENKRIIKYRKNNNNKIMNHLDIGIRRAINYIVVTYFTLQ